MGRVLLHNAVLLDPEAAAPTPGSLLLADGRIAARLEPGQASPGDAERVDLAGRGLAPGFLDLHFHGSLIFAGAEGFGAALDEASASLLAHGTTAYLATTAAWSAAELAPRVARLAALLAESREGAAAIGLHLEGPWISREAAGAQPAAAIRDYDPVEGAEVLARGEGLVRMVTLAPERAGAPALLAALEQRGIVAALGHSAARAEQVESAVERGARHVTHLFNAMGTLHHRQPGLAGAALCDDRLSCDLICDGVHVDPRMVRLAARAKRDRLVLITDRVDLPDGEASFGSGALRDDGVALRLADGRLAGSRVTLDRALRNARVFAGLSLLEAVAACSLRPARVLGVEAERGTLRQGARADLVVLGDDGEVCETWLAGQRAFAA
ncbi:MAG: N-acetylglucosamine-6-phosphate deacetylase [Myxococcota bacterium]